MTFNPCKIIIFLILGAGIVQGQVHTQTPFTMGESWEVGARAMSLGGAFTGVADDYSALYYNPAGLAQLRNGYITGTFSHMQVNNRATFLDVNSDTDASFTKMNNLGVVLPVPTYQGSLVLGFGFHRTRGFGKAITSKEVERVLINPYVWVGDQEQQLGIDFPEVYASGEELLDGELTETSFGGSMEVSPGVYIGGAINFWSGSFDNSWYETWIGGVYDVDLDGDAVWDTTAMLTDFEYNTHFQETYSGVNFTFGALISANQHFRIGGSVKTPVTLTGKQDWDYLTRQYVYEGYENIVIPDDEDDGYIEYKITSPWVFRAGVSINAGALMLSGDVELKDYSQMKYKTEPPTDEEGTMSEANLNIRRDYRNTTNFCFGGQLTVPGTGLRLRGGYAVQKSPFADAKADWDKKIWSIGTGYTINDQFILDVAYASTSWVWEDATAELITKEDVKIGKVLVSLIYRM